jgi:hypothetical protein
VDYLDALTLYAHLGPLLTGIKRDTDRASGSLRVQDKSKTYLRYCHHHRYRRRLSDFASQSNPQASSFSEHTTSGTPYKGKKLWKIGREAQPPRLVVRGVRYSFNTRCGVRAQSQSQQEKRSEHAAYTEPLKQSPPIRT